MDTVNDTAVFWDESRQYEVEDIPPLPAHNGKAAEIFDKYNAGIEPLDNWATEDLVELVELLDQELQSRAP